ncbi:MAG: hybrid sensor histidine kinase/response regulator, partial [Myxococcaceae bacterium]|nr:hybrid sensor histidine kinase/response regulator [Myxococcaceae bacterium]
FADLCFIDVANGAHAERVAVVVASPAKKSLTEALKRGPLPPVELSEPLLLTDAAPAALAMALPDGPDRRQIVAECDARSLMMLPLAVAGRALGLMGLVMAESGRRYTAADLIFARDLAARVAMTLENKRLHREAQAAVRARQDVLSTVSHELKTPLTGALLNADALIRTAPEGERRAGRSKIEHIRRSLQQMNYLVDDLLDLGSIDAGRLAIAKADFGVAALMTEATELLAPQAQHKNVAFEIDAPDDTLWVHCDRHRLVQVLSNVLSNAVKFTPEGRHVKLQAVREGEQVRVTVADEGPGMSAAIMRHLFERFSQAKETARQGRGLGLFISKGIIEAHGGAIWVESDSKRGTRVHFTLPAVPKPKQAAFPPPVVLVVEDDQEMRELTCELLVDVHFGAASVSNGREALDYLHLGGARPRVIVADLAMPVMTGQELVAALKAEPALAAIPVVLVSNSPGLEQEAKALGVAGSLPKPFDEREFLKLAARLGVKPS